MYTCIHICVYMYMYMYMYLYIHICVYIYKKRIYCLLPVLHYAVLSILCFMVKATSFVASSS